jgi:hypothetical protein
LPKKNIFKNKLTLNNEPKMWTSISDNPIVSSTGDSSVRIKFPCSNCHKDIITECFNVPSPNPGDNEEESKNSFEIDVTCDCGEDYVLDCTNGNGGFYVNIDNVDSDDVTYEVC